MTLAEALQSSVPHVIPDRPIVLIVVTIFNGGSVRRQLREMGYTVVSFAQFYRAKLLKRTGIALPYGSIDSTETIRKNAPAIEDGCRSVDGLLCGEGIMSDEALRRACHMWDETGERDDVTVDDTGCVVNGDIVKMDELQAAKERATYEAWRKAEERRGKAR